MSKTVYKLDYADMLRLNNAIAKCEGDAETRLNNYLGTTGLNKITNSMTNLLPLSKKGKKHAKTHKWYNYRRYNLALVIGISPSYYYLYYPLTATGTSRKKTPNDFLGDGLYNVYDEIVDDMVTVLDDYYNEEFLKER